MTRRLWGEPHLRLLALDALLSIALLSVPGHVLTHLSFDFSLAAAVGGRQGAMRPRVKGLLLGAVDMAREELQLAAGAAVPRSWMI